MGLWVFKNMKMGFLYVFFFLIFLNFYFFNLILEEIELIKLEIKKKITFSFLKMGINNFVKYIIYSFVENCFL